MSFTKNAKAVIEKITDGLEENESRTIQGDHPDIHVKRLPTPERNKPRPGQPVDQKWFEITQVEPLAFARKNKQRYNTAKSYMLTVGEMFQWEPAPSDVRGMSIFQNDHGSFYPESLFIGEHRINVNTESGRSFYPTEREEQTKMGNHWFGNVMRKQLAIKCQRTESPYRTIAKNTKRAREIVFGSHIIRAYSYDSTSDENTTTTADYAWKQLQDYDFAKLTCNPNKDVYTLHVTQRCHFTIYMTPEVWEPVNKRNEDHKAEMKQRKAEREAREDQEQKAEERKLMDSIELPDNPRRIQIKSIQFLDSEHGPVNGRDMPFTVNSFREADEILAEIAKDRLSFPGGGYFKTSVMVTWQDGTDHQGRWDVMHPDRAYNDNTIKEHLLCFANYIVNNTDSHVDEESRVHCRRILNELALEDTKPTLHVVRTPTTTEIPSEITALSIEFSRLLGVHGQA